MGAYGSALGGAALAAAGLFAATVASPADEAPPSITVSGQAGAEVPPDRATLTVGVEAQAPSAAAASAEVARRTQAVLDRIKAEGIAADDVATGSIGLVPLFPDPGPKPGPQAPVAYRAETSLIVPVSPPDKAGLVAARLIDGGASTLEGIAFSARGQEGRLDGLRGEAVRDARRKAEIYAAALGLKLGGVVEVTPEGGEGQAPVYARAAKMAAGPTPAIPVAPGLLSLRTGVTIRWRLVP